MTIYFFAYQLSTLPAVSEVPSKPYSAFKRHLPLNSFARFYMSCFQLNVGGSGTAEPPTVNFPGAYGASDPGILIDIYTSPAAYASKLSLLKFLNCKRNEHDGVL